MGHPVVSRKAWADHKFLLNISLPNQFKLFFSVVPASSPLERGLLSAAATSSAEPPSPALAQFRRLWRLGHLVLQRRVRAGLGPLGLLRLPTSPRFAGADIFGYLDNFRMLHLN